MARGAGPADDRTRCSAPRLWDRSSPYDATLPPVGDLVVHDRRTLLGLAVNPDLWFGEAYMAGRLDVRGPIEPSSRA